MEFKRLHKWQLSEWTGKQYDECLDKKRKTKSVSNLRKKEEKIRNTDHASAMSLISLGTACFHA